MFNVCALLLDDALKLATPLIVVARTLLPKSRIRTWETYYAIHYGLTTYICSGGCRLSRRCNCKIIAAVIKQFTEELTDVTPSSAIIFWATVHRSVDATQDRVRRSWHRTTCSPIEPSPATRPHTTEFLRKLFLASKWLLWPEMEVNQINFYFTSSGSKLGKLSIAARFNNGRSVSDFRGVFFGIFLYPRSQLAITRLAQPYLCQQTKLFYGTACILWCVIYFFRGFGVDV